MDLGLTQPVWTRFIGFELAIFLRMFRELRNQKRRFSTRRNRIRVKQYHNDNGFTGAFALTGAKLGVNTDNRGRLFIRIADETPGAGQAQISLYKATGAGGGDLVARGSGNNNTTVTLAEQNSSGLSGTVPIGVVTANEATDAHFLEVYPDWGLQALSTWDGSVNEDQASYAQFTAMLPIQERLVDQQINVLRASCSAWLANRGKILMESGQTVPITARTRLDGDAVITSYVGILEDMRRNMADETSPAAQKVVKNVVTADAVDFAADNRGAGTATGPTVTETCPIGTIKAVCSEESTIGRQVFDLSVTDADGRTIQGRNQLVVGESFSDPDLGIFGLLIEPEYDYDAGDDDDFATPADFEFENVSDANTSDALLHLKLVAGTADPAKFCIEFYKSASYDSGQLVGKTTEGAAGATVTIKQRNQSGLGGTCKIGDAPSAGATCELDLQPFRPSDDVGGVADEFTIEVSRTSMGEFQEGINELFDYLLNSGTSGSETISDDLVKAGSHPDFDVAD